MRWCKPTQLHEAQVTDLGFGAKQCASGPSWAPIADDGGGSASVVDFVHPVEAVIPGARGRVLAVLAHATGGLNLRTLARLSKVSPAQASRMLPALVELGMVERREVGTASVFRLLPGHVAARAIVDLAGARDTLLAEMGWVAAKLPAPPVSAVVFGSFARGGARAESDLDVLFVRPAGVSEDDEIWADSVEVWRHEVGELSGNAVEILEADTAEVAQRLHSKHGLWKAIQRDGILIHGLALADVAESADG